MKTIHLPKTEKFPAKELIEAVCGQAQAGANVEQIRRRIRVIDALEKCGDERLTLEDADHEFLRSLYSEFKFTLAHADIVIVAEAIADAKAD